jgi:peptide/nickel transport system ATP-binding protein
VSALLEISGLTKEYVRRRLLSRPEVTRAVDNVDLQIAEGSITALTGASGSGKSTLARCLVGLESATRGSVSYRGEEISRMDPAQLLRFRQNVQLVFQEASGSLNPRFTALSAVAEPLTIARAGDRAGRERQAARWVEEVGLPLQEAGKPALEFSGGQRQRLAIARALTLQPEVIIFDEAFSGLDVPIQTRLLDLLRALQEAYNLTYLFISHDLSLLARVCREVAVMCGGRIVEREPIERFLSAPAHPYSRKLVQAIPRLTPECLA